MSAVQIREALHEYIDTADEKKLEAIYTVLKDSIDPDYKYQANELEAVYARRELYKEGISEIMTTEEFVRYVRQNNL
jgi:hypothetical protein